MKCKRVLFRLMFSMFLFLFINSCFATNYYVDPSSSSTTSNGSLASPWKNITQVNNAASTLKAGDSVFFKRGQVFSGRLNIGASGSAGSPIVYTNYGSGSLPVFNNAITDIINIYNRQYIVIDGIKITDNTINPNDHTIQANVGYGIIISNSPNCTIKNCEITLIGIGIEVSGSSNNTTITGNYMYNLRMVRNTVGGDDDYGANPMVIGTSNNLIEKNRFEECWATSYDYGYDGGAVEFYGSTMNDNKVMYNTAINCNGFIEIGSGTNGIAQNNIIAYNKIINCGNLGVYQNGSTFTVTVNNLQYYNNTIIETVKQYAQPSVLFWMAGTGSTGMLVVKNNIFWLSSGVNVAQTKLNSGQMIHTNNIFRMTSGTLGVTQHSSETVSASINLFLSTIGDPSAWNLELIDNSLAIDYGVNVGITKDFLGNSITNNPDAGMLEKIITAPPVDAKLIITSTQGIISCFGGTTTVQINASGGTAPYSGTGTFTTKAGTFVYVVSDSKGIKDSITVNISQPSELILSVTAGTISTIGGTTSIYANGTGGVPTYTYNINGGSYQTSNTFTGIYAGNYSVGIKDQNGCSQAKSISVTEPASLYTSGTVTKQLTIYPNPSNSWFTVTFNNTNHRVQSVNLIVKSNNGNTVYTASGDTGMKFQFGSAFIPGNYYLTVVISNKARTYTLIKQ